MIRLTNEQIVNRKNRIWAYIETHKNQTVYSVTKALMLPSIVVRRILKHWEEGGLITITYISDPNILRNRGVIKV